MTDFRTDTERAFQHIVALTKLGPRVAGTPEEAEGIAYIATTFEQYGLKVLTPEFPIMLWRKEKFSVSAGGRRFTATAVPFAGTLPPGKHRLPLVYLETGSRYDLEHAGDVSGKAWLMSRDAYVHYPDTELAGKVAPFKPALLIFTAAPGHIGGVPTVFYNFRDRAKMPAPPCLVMGHQDVAYLATKGIAELEVQLEADVVPAVSRNVIGLVEGTEHPDEIIVVCAHHDSAPSSPGAVDNAGGAAVVLELARAVKAAGVAPKRTVHFAIWGSHETGMHGSEFYIRDAIASGAKVVAAINLDGIGMSVGQDHLSILGGRDWNDFIDGVADETGIEPSISRGPGYTDFTNFGAAGIPSVSIAQAYFGWNHTPGDDVDKCAPRGLLKPLEMTASLLQAILAAPDYRPEFGDELRSYTADFNGRWGWSNFTPYEPEQSLEKTKVS
jgi:hypothetical protein